MSNPRLAALRETYKKEIEQKQNKGKTRRKTDYYPFWDMDMNKKAVVRILPDLDEDNPFIYYVEKAEHTLSIDGKNEKVPCVKMYGEQCPICKLSADYYKREGKDSAQGKYYWRKLTSLVRVLVVTDPLKPDEETGETSAGKVCTTQFSWQIMETIKSALLSEDMGDIEPWSLTEGLNFTIAKTALGEKANYTVGSGFVRNTSAIDPNIELINLSSLLPPNPGLDAIDRKLNLHLGNEFSHSADAGDDDASDDASDDDATVGVYKANIDDTLPDDVPPPAKTVIKEVKAESTEVDNSGQSGADMLADIRRQRAAKQKQKE